jgi:hypothetical protein
MKVRWFLTATVLAMVVLGLAVTWVATMPISWALVLLAAMLSALPFTVGVVRRQFDVFEPIYLFALSYFVLFTLHPVAQLITSAGAPTFVGYAIGQTYGTALAIGAVGAVLFYVGYYLPLGRDLGQRLPLPLASWSSASLAAYVVLAAVAAIGALSLFLFTNGGLSILGAFFSGRNPTSSTALQQSSGYLYSAPLLLAPVGILVISLNGQRWRLGAFLGLALVAASQVLTIGLGGRSWILPALVALFFIWYLRRNARPGPAVITIALALIFLFGVTLPRQYRNTDSRNTPLSQILIDDILSPGPSLQDFFAREDTAMVDGLAVELQFVPQHIPYQLGRTYLEAASRPVPRAVWADKPRAAETQLMATIWPQLATGGVLFSFSIFGEPYLNFGWLGVTAAALLFGVFWRVLYAWFKRAPRNPWVFSLYSLSWPFLFVYMSGGIGLFYQRHLIYVLPVLLAYLLIRVRRPPNVSASALNAASCLPVESGARL